jgi:NAD(P)-dependent dehydrogenase (short-subunit alcohol dehydrogenase family)
LGFKRFNQELNMDISGKVFIVTGGASGLGEGTARMLAAKGGKVVTSAARPMARPWWPRRFPWAS